MPGRTDGAFRRIGRNHRVRRNPPPSRPSAPASISPLTRVEIGAAAFPEAGRRGGSPGFWLVSPRWNPRTPNPFFEFHFADRPDAARHLAAAADQDDADPVAKG